MNGVFVGYDLTLPDGYDHFDYSIVPHSTILYLEEDLTTDQRPDILDTLDKASLRKVSSLDVLDYRLFGEDSDVLVMRVFHEELVGNFNKITDALKGVDVYNASEFPYSPHVTVDYSYYGPTEGLKKPETIAVSGIKLWWGTETYGIM